MKNAKFDFLGIDHVVIVSRDMVETVDFYHRKLGMPVLHTAEYFDDEGDLAIQHWFFGIGDVSNHNAHIAAFWYRNGFQTLANAGRLRAPDGSSPTAMPIGSLMHIDLRVAPERMREYAEKLGAEGISYRHASRYFDPKNPEVMRPITTHDKYHELDPDPLMNSIYFFDPNGVYLEMNSWAPAWDKWRNDHVPQSDATLPKKQMVFGKDNIFSKLSQ